MIHKINNPVLAVILGLCTSFPIIVAVQEKLWLSAPGAERLLSYIALFLFLLIFFRRPFQFKMSFFKKQKDYYEIVPELPLKSKIINFLSIFIISIPTIAYFYFYTNSTYVSLFAGDHDYTMISAALNETAKGYGILTTAFVDTGSSGSFLAHHFSPTLFIYVPFYLLIPHTSHILYGYLLFTTFLSGFLLWSLLLSRLKTELLGPLAMFAIVSFFPLSRLASSLHFEILIFPLSALLFLGIFNHKRILFFTALFLWLGVKEDMAIYLLFFGFALYTMKNEYRYYGKFIIYISLAYFLIHAGISLTWKSSNPDFFSYYRDVWNHKPSAFKPFLMLLMAAGFMPFFHIRLFLLCLLPIFFLHVFSFHPWHGTIYSHYVYSLIPFLLFGMLLSFIDRDAKKSLRGIFLSLFLILYASSSDSEYPVALKKEDPRYPVVESYMKEMSPNSCLITQIPFSAHAPLHMRVFPVRRTYFGAYNPDSIQKSCRNLYILLDLSDARPPYYLEEDLLAMKEKYSSYKIKESGNIELYNLKQ